ncbi:MC/SLC25 family protein [Legionella longbeachae]|uniref:Similar to eukaryotic proteins, contains 2 mitochondrial carrier protein domains n=1 Tax=Legionella longbeachae serogroup 1 (strain NSW150) TaxID=661367 RepID=D3HM44_LEGLN|nr:MC/SLC25 family protein [Legionella longbeachae]VEE03956.1 Mitochondrial carrier protein [Legionella oakridgensis]HBD7397262.1 ABC transporter substrate-binding protein [Legionella pneumophila]ARB93187.1 ABC transporter substrate-binding protein [Legionella longbeachae]ARM33749.1 MC/SLC25 family protein [Legionella longbeachae]EEZ97092.1 putative solute carrier protein [Legionella longbeachae D-4968]
MGQEKRAQKTLWDAYAFGIGYTIFTTCIGHPAERLKVAIQTNLAQSSYSVIKQFAGLNLKHFSTGFLSCVIRQLGKVAYRPLLISHMPKEIDKLQLPMLSGGALKGAIASVFDTVVVSPIENIKTVQMRTITSHTKPITPFQAMNAIYQQRGLTGFFSGSVPTIGKAFPSWFYLFMTYNAIKTKREKQTFLSTILWATFASAPVAFATTPLDVLKSQQQAGNKVQQSLGQLASQIYKNHGTNAFFRGFHCRLVHKSLSTAGAYMILDMAQKM